MKRILERFFFFNSSITSQKTTNSKNLKLGTPTLDRNIYMSTLQREGRDKDNMSDKLTQESHSVNAKCLLSFSHTQRHGLSKIQPVEGYTKAVGLEELFD